MARDRNYLLGNGELLAKAHSLTKGSRPKSAPYPFPEARDRLIGSIRKISSWAGSLPNNACPGDEVVAELVLHPRYVSKTDQPSVLLSRLGLHAVGRKAVEVSPEKWGIKQHPESAASDKLFVAGKRAAFTRWAETFENWSENDTGAKELTQVESITPYYAEEKLFDLPEGGDFLAEVVLHNAGRSNLLDAFIAYANSMGVEVLMERRRVVGWLTFVPVRLPVASVEELAKFSFVRVVRSMPRLRTVDAGVLRAYSFGAKLPDIDAVSDERAVIFDGGIPQDVVSSLSRWVQLVEPPGIGAPVAAYEAHGLAVTSSFLFGPLESGKVVGRPMCLVDHVRVLDEHTGNDLEYYDVLDRITKHLDTANVRYRFGSLSLGPSRPITDDEVTAWTATFDQRLAHGHLLLAVAAGNDGDKDGEFGLNRLQPPSDGVNTLSVGASDSRGKKWDRAPYSCVGPGRSPGIFKPDGVSFGGTDKTPFQVIGPGLQCIGIQGTSFAAPFSLRSGAGVAALLGKQLHPLTVRALMVHRAQGKAGRPHSQVGWGRFLEDPAQMITCDDCEAVVVYQGELPLRQNLRARLAVPSGSLVGDVVITATLAISPDVDPEHVSTYTRGGLAVTFRPDATHFGLGEDGAFRKEPETADFFNTKRLSGRVPEYQLRKDAHKWEPVIRASRKVQGSALKQPFFDIYYHERERGGSQKEPATLRYALIVTVRCEAVTDLYQQTLDAHQQLLVPLEPAIAVQLTV